MNIVAQTWSIINTHTPHTHIHTGCFASKKVTESMNKKVTRGVDCFLGTQVI